MRSGTLGKTAGYEAWNFASAGLVKRNDARLIQAPDSKSHATKNFAPRILSVIDARIRQRYA